MSYCSVSHQFLWEKILAPDAPSEAKNRQGVIRDWRQLHRNRVGLAVAQEALEYYAGRWRCHRPRLDDRPTAQQDDSGSESGRDA